MYICSVAFPDDNFSVSLSTVFTRSSSTVYYGRNINTIPDENDDVNIPLRSS
jgi:hypothetical protein